RWARRGSCSELPSRSLLPRDETAPRALAGAGVGVSTLAVDGETLAVPESAVAAEVHEALDVLLNLSAQIAFDLVASLDDVADRLHVGFRELVHLAVLGDVRLLADLLRGRTTDSVDVRKRERDGLAAREIDS